MKVEKFVSGFLDTNTYLLEEDGHLFVIDPSDHAAVLERCREAATVTVLLTHEHFDHSSGLNRIRELCASSCRVIAGEICSERIQDTKANLSAYADVLGNGCHILMDAVVRNEFTLPEKTWVGANQVAE